MNPIFGRKYNFLHFIVFVFFAGLLLLHCRRSSSLDYADAIKRCAENKSTDQQAFFFPSPSCVIGAVLPKFESTTIKNRQINADYFKGKVSIVNFWFVGCAPCVAEVPGFNNLVKKYGKDKLRYVAVSLDSQEDVEAFLNTHEWDFDHVCNGKKIIEEIFHLPWGYPTTFLVDQNGVIIKNINGGIQDSTAVFEIQGKLIPAIDSLLKGL